MTQTQPDVVGLYDKIAPKSISRDPWKSMQTLAESLSKTPYRQVSDPTPQVLDNLNYEQYRAIRYRPEKAIWKGQSPFEIQLFHLGFLYKTPVKLYVFDRTARELQPLVFEKNLFQYDTPVPPELNDLDSVPGYAGFRIHYPLNNPEIADEIAVFLGASYFRLLGPGHAHGLSSRGLAINTAMEKPEEFPVFTQFWLVKPTETENTLDFFALLESPSLTGAYKFRLIVTSNTIMEVEAHLYAREDIEKLGIAPLTSMFLYGPDERGRFDDYRPSIHDSEGLAVATGRDQWHWRPLVNGRKIRLNNFTTDSLSGFGLAQRTREFSHFLDTEALYHKRPSQWVRPMGGDWGSGRIELFEIPSTQEFSDNIVAYWTPTNQLLRGEKVTYSYQLSTFDTKYQGLTLGQVKRTVTGSVDLPGQSFNSTNQGRRFVIDFEDIPAATSQNNDPLTPELQLSYGDFSELVLIELPYQNQSRATFEFYPDPERSTTLSLFLSRDGSPVTETWSYVWNPQMF